VMYVTFLLALVSISRCWFYYTERNFMSAVDAQPKVLGHWTSRLSTRTPDISQTYRLRKGYAIARVVSRRLPTAAVWFRYQVKSCGISGGHSGTGALFLRVLRFPLPVLVPPTTPHSVSSIIRGWYNMSISGRRTNWTVSPHPKELKNI
jgi:hypothetical protein